MRGGGRARGPPEKEAEGAALMPPDTSPAGRSGYQLDERIIVDVVQCRVVEWSGVEWSGV